MELTQSQGGSSSLWIPVDKSPGNDSIGMTFLESVKCVSGVDLHLSVTQAREQRTAKTQEVSLDDRSVLPVDISPLPTPPPALKLDSCPKDSSDTVSNKSPTKSSLAEESRGLPSQKSTFASVGVGLWTDKDLLCPVMGRNIAWG